MSLTLRATSITARERGPDATSTQQSWTQLHLPRQLCSHHDNHHNLAWITHEATTNLHFSSSLWGEPWSVMQRNASTIHEPLICSHEHHHFHYNAYLEPLSPQQQQNALPNMSSIGEIVATIGSGKRTLRQPSRQQNPNGGKINLIWERDYSNTWQPLNGQSQSQNWLTSQL